MQGKTFNGKKHLGVQPHLLPGLQVLLVVHWARERVGEVVGGSGLVAVHRHGSVTLVVPGSGPGVQ